MDWDNFPHQMDTEGELSNTFVSSSTPAPTSSGPSRRLQLTADSQPWHWREASGKKFRKAIWWLLWSWDKPMKGAKRGWWWVRQPHPHCWTWSPCCRSAISNELRRNQQYGEVTIAAIFNALRNIQLGGESMRCWWALGINQPDRLQVKIQVHV